MKWNINYFQIKTETVQVVAQNYFFCIRFNNFFRRGQLKYCIFPKCDVMPLIAKNYFAFFLTNRVKADLFAGIRLDLFNFDKNFKQASHWPSLDGIASWAKLTVSVRQFRNTAPLRCLDLHEVRRQHRHDEFLGLRPFLVAADEPGKVKVRSEEVAHRPDPLRTLKKRK